MKYFAFLLPFLFINLIKAQADEEVKVKYAVETFFYALNGKNEHAMKRVVKSDILMQTVVTLNESGKMDYRKNGIQDLIYFMSSTPDSIPFHEKILDYKLQIDGGIAHVWAPYEFWYNGEFSHCGVNSFQLMKEKDAWKIIHLLDSRRREDCKTISDQH